jgi:hypothetical protein
MKALESYNATNEEFLSFDWFGAGGWGKDGITQFTGVNDEAKKVFKEYL